MSDLGAEVESHWVACTVAGLMFLEAARARRGDRRARADMVAGGEGGVRQDLREDN